MENSKNLLILEGENGESIEYRVLFTFDSKETGKNYIVYTSDELDEAGKIKVYASSFDPSGKDTKLYPVETDKEMDVVFDILNSIQSKKEEENE